MSKDTLSANRSNETYFTKNAKRVAALVAVAALSACGTGKGGDKVEAAPVAPTATTSTTETVQPVTDSGSNYVPSGQEPYLYSTDPSLEEIHQPGVLTSEQLAIWQSGDPNAQTDVASNVIAPRISVAIHELYDAKKQGMTANIEWLTADQGTIAEIEEIAQYFADVSDQIDPAEGVDWFAFEVCRSDVQAQLDPALDRCSENNMPEGAYIDFSEGNPIQIAVTRETSANDDDVKENGYYSMFNNSTVRLNGDTLVLESLGN